MQKDKSIFKLDGLPVERFAEALGLPGMPKIKFLSKEMAKAKKNASRAAAEIQAAAAPSEPDGSSDEASDSSENESSGEESSPQKAGEDSSEQKVSLPSLQLSWDTS